MLAVVAVSSFGLGALLNHFVPAATAAGLSLTASGYLTGLRSFLSIPGRALIGPMAAFLGLRPALGVGFAVMLFGTIALIAAGPLYWIYVSAIIAGLVWGQTMPLQGLIASDTFGLRRLGTLMAVQTAIGNVALAIGAVCRRSAARRHRELWACADDDRRGQLRHAAVTDRADRRSPQVYGQPAVTLSINHCGCGDGCHDS